MTQSDRIAVERLLYNIAYSQDTLDWKLFVDCWVSQQLLTLDLTSHLEKYGKQQITAPDLAKMSHSALSGFDGTQHTVTNIIVDFHESKGAADQLPSPESLVKTATACAYINAYHYLKTSEESSGAQDRVIMRGIWTVPLKLDQSGAWRALGIKVARLVPPEGDVGLYELAKQRSDQGEGRVAFSW